MVENLDVAVSRRAIVGGVYGVEGVVLLAWRFCPSEEPGLDGRGILDPDPGVEGFVLTGVYSITTLLAGELAPESKPVVLDGLVAIDLFIS